MILEKKVKYGGDVFWVSGDFPNDREIIFTISLMESYDNWDNWNSILTFFVGKSIKINDIKSNVNKVIDKEND